MTRIKEENRREQIGEKKNDAIHHHCVVIEGKRCSCS